jgi:hypothetical protein
LISFCAWFASKAIPQKNSKNKTLGIVTKKQYFSSIKEEIRNETKDLSIWENHEEEWYSEFRARKLGRGEHKTQAVAGEMKISKDPQLLRIAHPF